jgi:hypothetical protein
MVDVRALYEGRPVVSDDEVRFALEFEKVGRTDLAGIVRNGKISRAFEFGIYADPQNRESFEGLLMGVAKAFEEHGDFNWESLKEHMRNGI